MNRFGLGVALLVLAGCGAHSAQLVAPTTTVAPEGSHSAATPSTLPTPIIGPDYEEVRTQFCAVRARVLATLAALDVSGSNSSSIADQLSNNADDLGPVATKLMLSGAPTTSPDQVDRLQHALEDLSELLLGAHSPYPVSAYEQQVRSDLESAGFSC